MLSKKSEQFLIELRMYLISKGKNDKQINEIIEELQDHLLQAETDGKNVEHIIGDSPQAYMKSIGDSLPTDYRELALLAPLVILLLAAYLSLGPAIEGIFSLSKELLWIALIGSICSISIYGLLLVKVFPKFFHSKWFYGIAIGVYLALTGLGVVALLWYKNKGIEPFYVATPFQNNLILLACIVIFISFSIYSKSWITILIPFFLSLGPLANRFIPEHINENPTYIMYTVVIIALVTALVIYLLYRKKKRETEQK